MSIITEALADARKIKKIAEENARLSLKEEFQPRIQRMLGQKIAEEDELEDDAPVEAPVEDDSLGLDAVDTPTDVATPEAPVEDEEPDLDELFAEMDDEFADEEPMEEEFMFEDEEWYDETENEPVDTLDEEGCEDGSEEDVYESILRELENNETGYDEKISEAKRKQRPAANITEVSRLKSELSKTKTKLNEAYRAVSILKKAVNETNLLNSKLMYFNKLNNAVALSEDRKLRIMNTMDKCKSIKECQLVYSTALNSFAKAKNTKRVVEGHSSKPVQAIKPASTQLNEGKGILNLARMQELAGITKPVK